MSKSTKSTKYDRTAQKRLGIDTKTLLQSAVDNKSGNCGGIRVQEYKLFWERMDKTETQDFLFDLLKKFLEEITSKDKDGLNLGAFVNTIQFICLFLPDSSSPSSQNSAIGTPQVKRWLKSWKKHNDQTNNLTQKFPATKNALQSLKAISDGKDLYNSSIIGCSTLHTCEEFENLHDIVKNPTSSSEKIKSAEQCFLYSYLCKLSRASEEQRMSILTQTRNKVQSMSSQLKINPRLAETTLLALLHMIKNFMSIAPVTDKNFLKRTMTTIQQFYLWPCPYGNVTRDLLELLYHEMRCPGACWVSSFGADALGATHKGKNKALFYITRSVESYDDEKSSNEQGRMWTKIMQLRLRSQMEKDKRMSAGVANMKVPPRTLPGATQAMIILHMFHQAGIVTPEDVGHFTKLKDSQASQLYVKLEEMIEESKNFELPEQAQQYQVKQLKEIQAELIEMGAKPKAGRHIKFVEKPEAPFFTKLPPISHILADCSNLKHTPEDAEFLRMQLRDFRPYLLYEGMEDLFSSIFSIYAKKPKPLYLPLVIAGDDLLLHIVLNTYLRIAQTNPRWLKQINVKFFLVPWNENSVASFIARHDSWYHRHIFVPFLSSPPFLIPWIDPEDLKREDFKYNSSEEELLPPATFLQDTMNLYARQAKCVCPISVYKLEGWEPKEEDMQSGSKDDADLPTDLIGFCLRVEIGQGVADGEKKGEPGAVYNPPVMDLHFTPMNLAGEELDPITEENISLNSLLIANIPRTDDKCFPPNPICPWLEMYAEPKSTAKYLTNDRRQHISQLSLECNNPTATFSVKVDGQSFGPYHKIKITRATMKKDVGSGNTIEKKKDDSSSQDHEIPVTLNIQTFFDINI